MSLVKRHLWLVVILGVMVVLSAGAVVLMVLFQGKAAARQAVLAKSQSVLQTMGGAIYKDQTAEALVAAADFRKQKLADIENYIRTSGQWTPLAPTIFDRHTDTDVYAFRNAYKGRGFQELRQTLNAFVWDSAKGLIDPEAQFATMYVAADAFHKHPWLDAPTLPRDEDEVMLRLRESQDDLWLMQDIVGAIKRTNDMFFALAEVPPEDQKKLEFSAIKELRRIDIGAQAVGLGRGGYEGATSRYLYIETPTGGATSASEEKQTDSKAMTLSGRASDNAKGRYRVLPFRVVVVGDAGNAPELIRQLTGTRSFITVLNVRYEMIPDVETQYRSYLLRPEIKTRNVVYGSRPLARLTLTCESLVFRLDKARPTVPPAPSESQKNADGN